MNEVQENLIPTIVVLIAVFNRIESTRNAISRLMISAEGHCKIQILVYDDGSTDGSKEILSSEFPMIRIYSGLGDNFWARSMNVIDLATSSSSSFDYLLWLNNDVFLDLDAIPRLIAAAKKFDDRVVVVGALRDGKNISYSGFQLQGKKFNLHFVKIEPSMQCQEVDVFNGNLVLIPRIIRLKVGAISSKFSHGWADMDYGLRVKKAQFKNILAPGNFGICELNTIYSAHIHSPQSLAARLRIAFGRKGLHPLDFLYFSARTSKFAWPIYYLINVYRTLMETLRRR